MEFRWALLSFMGMRKEVGHTLLEVLVSVTIIFILSVSSAFISKHLIDKNIMESSINRLLSALQLSRSEAIRRGEIVTFCGSSDLYQCDGNWRAGQLIKVKNHILHVFSNPHPENYWEWRSNLGKNHALEFTALGFSHGQQGSFHYISGEKTTHCRVVVLYTGAVRVEKG